MGNTKIDSNEKGLRVVLDDLCMRFLVNLPAVEYESFERLFFAIESAHWFYEDFYREQDLTLPRLPLKQFAAKIFDHTSLLQRYRQQVGKLTSQFQAYKQEVPTCGAAMLNRSMDKVVLVRGWGSTARWGFPKGKLAKDESEIDATIREVLEETGFDLTSFIDSSTYFIDSICAGRQCRIFVIPDVSEDTVFKTKTRKEISDIQWIPISILPDSPKSVKIHNKSVSGPDGKDIKVTVSSDQSSKVLFAHYGVAQFTKRLRSWIERRKKSHKVNSNPSTAKQSSHLVSNGTLTEEEIIKQKTQPVAHTSVNDPGFMSLDELKAVLGISAEKEKSDRPKKSKIRSSPQSSKRNTRKSKKEGKRTEDSLNKTTFGNDGGIHMNDSDRHKLFRQYVVQTDKIAAARGLQDDFWPVPFVTSKDFTEDELKDAEAASSLLSNNNTTNMNGRGIAKLPLTLPASSSSIESFSFNREAIRDSIMTCDSVSPTKT